MMPSSADIHRLPPEILLRIFSYLPPKDVAGVAKVNRCFSRLAPDACKRVGFFVLAAKAGKKAIVEHVIEGTTDDQRKTAFMLAAKNGHTEVLALLLPSIIEQNLATQQELYVALRDAALAGKAEAVNLLLAQADARWCCELVLEAAVEGGNSTCVDAIIAAGEPLPPRCKDAALNRAVTIGNATMVESLVRDGTNEIARQHTLWSAVCLYTHPHEDRVKIVRSLVKSLTGMSTHMVALVRAASYGHVEYVKVLLEEVRYFYDMDAVLAAAAWNGHTKLVDVLLKDGKCDPQNRSWAAVIGAAANGYAEVVTQLLQFMWNNQTRQTRSFTKLIIAAREGRLAEVMKVAGNDMNAESDRSSLADDLSYSYGAKIMTWSVDDVEEITDTLAIAAAEVSIR